jgi:hypothetical protein
MRTNPGDAGARSRLKGIVESGSEAAELGKARTERIETTDREREIDRLEIFILRLPGQR